MTISEKALSIIRNAKREPQILYGLHMAPGVAEYREPGKEPYRVFVNEDTIKKMDKSYAGKPVFVRHVNEVVLENLQLDADGYVFDSFYNKADGKHWCRFIVVSDKGHDAIAKGWRLSNAYVPQLGGVRGQWHGVDYDREVVDGEYEHLAIVPNPRYDESVVLTPEQFKAYNSQKEAELIRLANSKEETTKMKFKLFKRAPVENSADLEGVEVTLPKSGKTRTIEQLVNEVDEYELKMKEPQMANGDSMVDYGGEQMSVNSLLEKHKSLQDELAALKEKSPGAEPIKKEPVVNEEDEAKKKAEGEKAAAEKKANDDKAEKDKAEKEKADKEKVANDLKLGDEQKRFDKMKNAHQTHVSGSAGVVDTSDVQAARGVSRYGSGS